MFSTIWVNGARSKFFNRSSTESRRWREATPSTSNS